MATRSARFPGLWVHPNGSFYFRERVPKALIPILGCKLISKSLGTRDRDRALPLWRQERDRVDRLLAAASNQASLHSTDQWRVVGGVVRTGLQAMQEHPPAPAGQLELVADVTSYVLGQRPLEALSDGARAVVAEVGVEQLLSQLQADMQSLAADYLRARGIIPTASTLQSTGQKLASKLPVMLGDAARAQGGDYSPSAAVAGLPVGEVSAPQSGLTLEALQELWVLARMPRPGAITHCRQYCRELAGFAGTEDAAQIRSSVAKAYRLQLLQRVAAGELKLNSAKARIRALSIAFGVGAEQDRLAGNPFAALGRWPKAAARSSRRSFSRDEALAVLEAAKAKGDWQWWVHLIACCTGARLREVAQLRRLDLVERDGVKCLQIVHQPGHQWPTTLKNESAQRVIPIPEPVLRAGFWKWGRSQLEGYLFRGRNGRNVIGSASQNVSVLIRGAGVEDPDAVFHSWRHGMEDMLRNTPGVSTAQGQAITGRIAQGSERLYGGQAGAKALKAAMELMDWEWLEPVLRDELNAVKLRGAEESYWC